MKETLQTHTVQVEVPEPIRNAAAKRWDGEGCFEDYLLDHLEFEIE